MVKKLAALVLGVMLVTNLIACNGQVAEDQEEGASGLSDPVISDGKDKKEIKFSWWGSGVRHEATMAVIELYESMHPEIDIVPEYMSYYGYEDKLMAQLRGGNAADIYTCVPEWLPAIDNIAGFYDLEGLIDVSGQNANILQASRINNKLGGVCVSLNAKIIVYNKTYLNELGLSVQQQEYRISDMFDSWEDVYRMSEGRTYGIVDPRLTKSYLPIYGYTELQKTEPFPFSDHGLSITATEFTSFLTAFDGLDEGALMPPAESLVIDDLLESPVANRTAMFHIVNAGSFSILQSQTTDELAMLPLPVGPNGEQASEARPGLLLSLYPESQVKEEALAFLDFFTNSEEAALLLKTTRGVLPTENQRNALLEAEGLLTEVDRKILLAVDEFYSEGMTPFLPGPVNSSKIVESLLFDTTQDYLFGSITAEEAGIIYIEEAEKLMSEEY